MSWNYYLHVWQIFAICPFANAVLLTTTQSKPATAISLGDTPVELTGEGDTESVTLTITPNDATTEITYRVLDESVATVEKVSETSATITSVSVGETKLIATSDNGLYSELSIVVSSTEETEQVEGTG